MIVLIIITILYVLLIGVFIIGFLNIKEIKNNNELSDYTCFSIVIPFRNEANRIAPLLKSIEYLEYSKTKFEIIFIDDKSQDESVNMIHDSLKHLDFNYTIINNIHISNSPKKDAITLAISNAKHDWILTSDADCELPKKWLKSYNHKILGCDTKMIIGPVKYKGETSLISKFEAIEYLSVQGITIGSFGIDNTFLCNGANLCYTKDLFNKINGFTDNNHIASGDDVFMLEKALNLDKKSVVYLKNKRAIVETRGEGTLKKMLYQRVRWASKTSVIKSFVNKTTAFVILLMNLGLIVGLLACLFGYSSIWVLLILFFFKFLIDFVLLLFTSVFFNEKHLLIHTIWSSIFYPLFCLAIVIFSLKKSYVWKGRSY